MKRSLEKITGFAGGYRSKNQSLAVLVFWMTGAPYLKIVRISFLFFGNMNIL